ncbi:hypothetical protein JTF06_13775 [Desemzia sp. RIT804]|uniref:O-antigen ligase family protein n=1 Tax=Desemzia sp. RIT 804 TaxID=2810209 RepID=UPI00194E0559|nr:hypothetical protein [Desemzia sp. RIT 804]MBM6615956.1 hypothetical protein [Desemzia sp. RIT 804]
MALLTYILIGAVFLGTQILDIELGIAKLSIYRLMIGVLCVLFLILMKKNDSRIKLFRNKLSNYYTGFYVFWFVYAVISVIWSQDLVGWLKSVFFIGTGMLAVLFITFFITKKSEIVKMYHVLFSMIAMHNFIGWYEILTGTYWFADLNKLDKYGTFDSQPMTRIPISIYANQNDYATMLAVGFFILIILFFYQKSNFLKFSYLIVMVSSFYLILRTQSRANLLGLLIGISIMVLVKIGPYVREVLMIKTVQRIVLVLGFLMVLAMLFMEPVQEMILTILTDNRYANVDLSSSKYNRIYLLLNGLYFLIRTFGIGVGAGNIEYWMEHLSVFPTFEIVNIHNWWGEILVGYGLLIFGLYLIMYVSMFIQLYRHFKSSSIHFNRVSSLGLMGLLGAFTVSSISSSSMMFAEWQWVFWGCIIAFIKYSEKTREVTHSTEEKYSKIVTKSRSVENGQPNIY